MNADDPRTSAAKTGAKRGAVAGLALAQIYLSRHSPLGFYTGSIPLVFLVTIGPGTAIGAAIGWWAATVD